MVGVIAESWFPFPGQKVWSADVVRACLGGRAHLSGDQMSRGGGGVYHRLAVDAPGVERAATTVITQSLRAEHVDRVAGSAHADPESVSPARRSVALSTESCTEPDFTLAL